MREAGLFEVGGDMTKYDVSASEGEAIGGKFEIRLESVKKESLN